MVGKTIAALFGGAGAGAFALWFAMIIQWQSAPLPVVAISIFAFLLLVISTLGLAAHLMLYAAGARSVIWYALAGLLIGGAFGFLVIAIAAGSANSKCGETLCFEEIWLAFLISFVIGATCSTTAWLIRRPDRDPPNPPSPTP